MQKITSAYANKMLRSLEEDKAFWVNKESTSSTYVAAVNEEPVVPEYDYMTVANTIDEIDRKILTIKHALNLILSILVDTFSSRILNPMLLPSGKRNIVVF